jgi:hypothetical protein
VEGLRRGLGAGAPFGRVRDGPVRWRGRARDEGPGGESAEGGGEAMVMSVVCAGTLLCGLLVFLPTCVCSLRRAQSGSSRWC